MGRNFLVLIVDDDLELCEALTERLTAEGYVVQCATHGANPLSRIREIAPDLLLIELATGRPGGLETLRRLEISRTWQRVPVIVTSEQAELEFELLDAFDFLAKPLDLQRLLEDVALLASRKGRGAPPSTSPLGEREFLRFQEYLILHSGLHFDQRNRSILERGLLRRMRAVGAADHQGYFQYLRRHGERRRELNKLLGLLTIGETYFFRFLAQFEALREKVLPELVIRNRKSRTLRIWSAGCAVKSRSPKRSSTCRYGSGSSRIRHWT